MRPLWPNLADAQGLPGSFRAPNRKRRGAVGLLARAQWLTTPATEPQQTTTLFQGPVGPVGSPPCPTPTRPGINRLNDKKRQAPRTQRSCRRPPGLLFAKQKKPSKPPGRPDDGAIEFGNATGEPVTEPRQPQPNSPTPALELDGPVPIPQSPATETRQPAVIATKT